MKKIICTLVCLMLAGMTCACGGHEVVPSKKAETASIASVTQDTTPHTPGQDTVTSATTGQPKTLSQSQLESELRTLFSNYVAAVRGGYEELCDSVLDGVDDEGMFENIDVDDPSLFAKVYKPVEFIGLMGTVIVGNVGADNELLFFAYEQDNAQLGSLSNIASRAQRLVAATFSDWDAEKQRAVVIVDNDIYAVGVQIEPDKDRIIIVMATIFVAS